VRVSVKLLTHVWLLMTSPAKVTVAVPPQLSEVTTLAGLAAGTWLAHCTINVDDTTAPTITTCAVTRNIEGCNTSDITGPAFSITTASSSEAVFENGTNQGNASDACGITSVTYIDMAAGTCPTVATRKWTVSDACGNSATCNQTINVDDNTPPSITCLANITVQCANQVPAANPASVVTSDNCGGTATVTFAGDVISNQTCVNSFTLTRTYRTTDDCGNSATCTQTITVFDNTLPSITCPANITVQCANQVPAVNTSSVVASDNCTGTVMITHVGDVITDQTCVNRFTLTRTYRAIDACGNSATCAQMITVFDNTPPGITLTHPLLQGVPNGGTIDVQCFGQDPEWDLPEFDESSINATDNCAGDITLTFTQVVEDEGNCPVDGYIILYRLTWTSTDECGNSNSAFVFLALIDTVPPVIHGVPDDITVNCDEIPEPPANIFAIDECLSAFVVLFEQTHPTPGCQDGQVIMRSWTARDDCGNETIEVQNITLVDEERPEFQLVQPELAGVSDGTVLNYTCNEGGIPEFYDFLDAESVYSPPSCGSSANISFDRNIFESNNCRFFGYLEQRTFHWVGVDLCGNETKLTIIARLIDTESPVLIDVPDTTCINDPALKDVDATDNCGHPFLRFWDVKIPNPCGSGMAVRRTYEVYDYCGNMSRDTAILIPNDHSNPIMEFVNPVLAELMPGEVLLIDCAAHDGQYTPFGVDDVSVEDSCTAGVNVNFTERVIETHDCLTNGIIATLELEWTVTDICGNHSALTIQTFIIDNTSPVLVNFKPEVTIGCNDDLPELFATDNCGDVSITTEESFVPGPCDYEYDVIRLVTARDPCGNSTTEMQTIHVGDGSGPIIEGVVEELCDDLSIPDVTAYDPCSGKFVEVTMKENTLDVPCSDGMVIERTWTAVDICGNVTEIRQTIVINDLTPPEILIPSYSVIRKFMDNSYNLVFLSQTDLIDKLNALDEGSISVQDDCDQEIIPEFTLEISYADDCDEDGYFERRVYTWVATDVCGNAASITFSVDIMDDIAPVLSGVPDDATIICEQLLPAPLVHADDPAQPVAIVYSESIDPGNGPGVYVVTREWIATDACGNSSVAVQHITWIPDTFLDCDIILPDLVECNSHGVVISSDVIGGFGPFTYAWEIFGEENFIQEGQGTDEIIIYVGWADVEVNLTVTDAFGCVTMCTTTLDCFDSALNPFAGLPPSTNAETILMPGTNSTSVVDQTPAAYLKQLNLWPNPANGSVNLSFDCSVNHEIQFTLTNFLGQDVLSDQINAHKGSNNHKIDVSKIPQGSYLMQVKSEREMYTKVVVIMRND